MPASMLPQPDAFRGTAPASGSLGQIEQFLAETLATLPEAPRLPGRPRRGRPPVLPALCLWAGLLVCVLRGFTRHTALWRLLTLHGLWDFPRVDVSDQTIYDRLARGGLGPLQALFAQVSAAVQDRPRPPVLATLAPFATAVYALDETTLDHVARRVPVTDPTAAPPTRRLPGKLAVVFDVRRQVFHTVRHLPNPHQNEKVACWDLLAGLEHGALLLFDLGYFSFRWFDTVTEAGHVWVSRLRAKTSYTVTHTYFAQGDTFDGLIWLGAYRADQTRYVVRLVRFRLGPTTYTYLTNQHDPRVLPLEEIAGLYQRRWDIELAFNLIKTHLGLHLVWSNNDVLILQQVWAVLIIAQVMHTLRLEIATAAGVDPFDVSMRLLVELLPRLVADGHDPVAVIVARGRLTRIIRPSTRLPNRAPPIPHDALTPAPPGLVLQRTPRYAGKA